MCAENRSDMLKEIREALEKGEEIVCISTQLVEAGVLPQDDDFASHHQLVPMQPGDLPVTFADTSGLEADFGWKPDTSLRTGLRRFAEWYRDFYQL